MSFEGPEEKNYAGTEEEQDKQSKKKDPLKKKEGKKEKKEKGYVIFDEEESEEEVVSEDIKSPSKMKKSKPFRFPKKDIFPKSKEKEEKKEKEGKREEKEKKKDEKEGKKHKSKDKKKSVTKTAKPESVGVCDKPVFGVSLAVSVERNRSHDGIELPALFRECIDYIEEHGLSCEGIYRISGVKSKIQTLKDLYNNCLPVYLEEHEPNIVASLLKQYLRELPEPVLTTALMPKFEEASTIKNERKRVEAFHNLIEDLPICNRLLLSWMIVHMTHVIEQQKENKMSLQNVSIVLSPTMQISHRVLNVLFSHSHQLFKDTIIKRYVPPLKPATSRWSLELPDTPAALEEELLKQESLLSQLHDEIGAGIKDPAKEEQLWEVQRVVTQLKRKIKLAKKAVKIGDERRKEKDTHLKPVITVHEDVELNLELKKVPQQQPSPVQNEAAETAPSEEVTADTDEVTENASSEKPPMEDEPPAEPQPQADAPEKVEDKTEAEPVKSEEIEEKKAKLECDIDETVEGDEEEVFEAESEEEADTFEQQVEAILEGEAELGEETEGEKEVTEEKMEEEIVSEETPSEITEEGNKTNEVEMEGVKTEGVKTVEEVKAVEGVEEMEEEIEPEVFEDEVDDEEMQRLLEEEYALRLEEEELLAIESELRQKIETEKGESERLTQEIDELQYLRQDSDMEDLSSSEDSSYESEDEEDLQEILNQLLKENEDLEKSNTEMCQKIHEERMICLDVKVEIRLLQQKQLENSMGNDFSMDGSLVM